MAAQVVWLKRDLRIHDHRPLVEASRCGPVVCLYVYEPEIYGSDEFDPAHLGFIDQSLEDLDGRLRAIGGSITYRVGSMPDVMDRLSSEIEIDAVHAHEETGLRVHRLRDAGVRNGFIHEPHKMGADEQRRSGCAIGRDYPAPIVEHATAYRAARERIHAVRRRQEARAEARGSRISSATSRPARTTHL